MTTLTVCGDRQDGAVEHVHGDVDRVRGGRLTRVDPRVVVLDVVDYESGDRSAAGVPGEALRALAPVADATVRGRGRRRRQRVGLLGGRSRVEQDHLRIKVEELDKFSGVTNHRG